jgi:hypothetical protein
MLEASIRSHRRLSPLSLFHPERPSGEVSRLRQPNRNGFALAFNARENTTKSLVMADVTLANGWGV